MSDTPCSHPIALEIQLLQDEQIRIQSDLRHTQSLLIDYFEDETDEAYHHRITTNLSLRETESSLTRSIRDVEETISSLRHLQGLSNSAPDS